ncbi:MAG TPA: 50S ribosomal protein L22 [Clostridia bacterium]
MATRIRTKAAERQKNKDTRPKAIARYVRISPYKVRRVIDLVRGKSYNEAIAILKNTPLGAAEAVMKVINSAAANAEHNNNLAKKDLYIAEIFADQGPTLKRIMPRARGSADRILKRTSHITVILDVREAK